MSLAINLDAVGRVLLPDGWHDILRGSLELDAYEMHHSDEGLKDWPNAWPLRGGSEPVVPAVGFTFRRLADGAAVSGPLTSLMAVEVPS